MSSSKSTVLVVGSSGNTGFPISLSLLDSGRFNVALLCRQGSEDKPRILELQQKGAKVRLGDIIENSVEELEKHLTGIDILLITVSSMLVHLQEKILLAASKSDGLKRVVPSEFAIVHSGPGTLSRQSTVLRSQLKIRALVKELNLPYTYINVGWWMDLVLPYPSSENGHLAERSHYFIGTGDVETAVTARADIGRFTALIIDDPRTLNAQVFCRGDEVSLNEIYEVAERLSGEDMRSKKREFVSDEDFWNRLKEAQANYEQSPSRVTLGIETYHLAYHIMFVNGENTSSMARKLGYLDAKDLYPEFRPQNLEEFAKQFYDRVPQIIYPSRKE